MRLHPALLAAALVAPAALPAQQRLLGRGDSTFVWSKRLPAGAQVTIRNYNGPVEVREASGDQVEVRATKRGSRSQFGDVAFEVDESDGVTVCPVYDRDSACDDRGRNWSGDDIRVRVAFVVAVPRSMRVRASTGNGDVSIAKAGAEVNAATGNGRVTVGETEGQVRASTGNGDVEVESAKGPVRVSTGNGRVFVGTSVGPVTASTGNGEIDVRMRALPRDAGDMSFTSGSGSIRVSLPADFAGEIDTSSGNGTLRSDFDITVSGRLDPRRVRGTIAGGRGPTIRMRTGSGRMELRKSS